MLPNDADENLKVVTLKFTVNELQSRNSSKFKYFLKSIRSLVGTIYWGEKNKKVYVKRLFLDFENFVKKISYT